MDVPAEPAVVGFGLALIDRQVFVPRLPGPDEKTTATEFRVQVGGPVPTALAQLRKLGGPGGALLSGWGDDADGRFLEADLAAAGLRFDAALCQAAPHTGFADVRVGANGERSIVAARPAFDIPPAAIAAAIRGCDLLHTDGWPGGPAVAAAEAVKAGGGAVSVDLGSSPKPDRLLQLTDVLNLPAAAAVRITGVGHPDRAARELRHRGPSWVTVTNGSHGCWFAAREATGETNGFVPAFPADAVDTCGAGDCFCGALLFGRLAGWPLSRAVRFASAAASLKVRRVGNREALPDRAAVEGLLAEG